MQTLPENDEFEAGLLSWERGWEEDAAPPIPPLPWAVHLVVCYILHATLTTNRSKMFCEPAEQMAEPQNENLTL